MKSHEYANSLKRLAEILLSRPEFETHSTPRQWFMYSSAKGEFLSAVRALGGGKKEWTSDELQYSPTACSDLLMMSINRNVVCRKVQEEKWECEPLLSEDEERQLESWKAHDIQETEFGGE